MKRLAIAALLVSTMPALAQDHLPDPAIERVVHATYDALTFHAGERADVAHIRSHFTPAAQVAFVRGDSLVASSIDDYLARWSAGVASLESLEEWEIWGRTEQFGTVAHRLSTYAVRVDGSESERGVILFQFMRLGGRWLIQSMIWQSERDGLVIPAEYTGESGGR